MARWLIVKVMREEFFDAYYRANQIDGVDCMEVPEGRLPQWILEDFNTTPPLPKEEQTG